MFATRISRSLLTSGGGAMISKSSRKATLPLLISARSIFINSESTPNPHSMKFLPGVEILPEEHGTGLFFQRTDAYSVISKSPLAKSLFFIPGVKGIFFGRDFITITKNSDESWKALKPQLFSKILDHLAEGQPILLDSHDPAVSDTTVLDSDSEVVATIKELIESRVRPSVQEDGGDIFYEGFDPTTGMVSVRLAGSCVGCPSSSVTLKNGVENMLMHYIPEVTGVENVEPHDDEGEPLKLTPQPL